MCTCKFDYLAQSIVGQKMWTIICETQKSVLESCKIAVKNCDSCLQALDLSDAFLAKLNVARESVDDTASAAEVFPPYILFNSLVSEHLSDKYIYFFSS